MTEEEEIAAGLEQAPGTATGDATATASNGAAAAVSGGAAPASAAETPVRCGARTKSTGKPCRGFAMKNGRCRLHGGTNPGADPEKMRRNGNAVTHGLYRKGILPHEEELYPGIPLGNIDAEIKMLKLKLCRAYEAQRRWEEQRAERTAQVNEEELEVEAIEKDIRRDIGPDGTPGETVVFQKIIRRRQDFSHEIKSLTRLIIEAEARRAQLAEIFKDAGFYDDVAQKLREFTNAALLATRGEAE